MLKSIGVYFSANLVNALIPFLLMPILTRYLTVSEYGEVAVFVAIVGFFSALVGTTFVGSVGRKFFDKDFSDREYSGYVASAITLGIAGASIVLLIIAIFGLTISEWLKISSSYLYVGLAVAFFGFVIQIKLNQYQIRKQPKRYAKLQISWTAINATLSVGAVVLLSLGSEGRINAQFVSALFIMVVSIYLLLKENQLGFLLIERKYYRELVLFGLPLLPHVLGGYFLNTVDRVVIGNQIDLEAAGLYAVAFQLAGAAGLVFDAINKAFQPWLFEKLNRNLANDKLMIVKLTYVWFIALIIGCFGFSFISTDVLKLIAGDKYMLASEIFGVLLWAQVFKGMYFFVVNYFFYVKRTGWLSSISVLGSVIQVFLLILLMDYFGLIGAAYAYVVSMAFRFVATWFVSMRMYEMPWLLLRK